MLLDVDWRKNCGALFSWGLTNFQIFNIFLKYNVKNNLLLCGITRKLEYFLCLIPLQLQAQPLGYVNFPCSKYNSEKKNQAIVQKKFQTVLMKGVSSSMYEAWGTCFCLFLSLSETWVSGRPCIFYHKFSFSLIHLKCFSTMNYLLIIQ